MDRARSRTIVWVLAAMLTGIAASLLLAIGFSGTPSATRVAARPERGRPAALARHLERLRAIPGRGGEGVAGGRSAGELAFVKRAYPGRDIPLARIRAARAAFTRVRGRNLPSGRGRPGTWTSVGPTTALYPATVFRSSFSYVPAAYVASGRTTALAISPVCSHSSCTLWIAAAGGGIWRTDRALAGTPNWRYVSGAFGVGSVSSIELDPNDSTGRTLWVGTGEANASGDSGAGVGVYKSTDGGTTWTGPLGVSAFDGRAVGTIAVKPGDPNTIFAGTTLGVRGISSVAGGAVAFIPGAPDWGLYRSTDGGSTWTLIHNGAATLSGCTSQLSVVFNATPCSPIGVRRVILDPVNANTVYAASFARGVWRSADGGATWTQINPSLDAATSSARPEIAVNVLSNGNTRMYVAEGAAGSPMARLFRSDSVRTGVPTFTNLTSPSVDDPGFGSHAYCSGQCWYDNFVVSPSGHPDVVYLGGSYAYGETGGVSNGRGLGLSTDAGVSFTDMTMDATDPLHPNGLHPDQHALVVNPNDPYQFFEANDGGIMRSSGAFADVSNWCDTRGLQGATLARCKQLLSRVPTELQGINKGLTTLQFQSLSVSPFNSNVLQGGTQDNGTWQSTGNPVRWVNTMIGDGGQSGFDVANPNFRFHTFFDASPDVNFSGGDTADWNWIGSPIYGTGGLFYVPIIADPVVSRTMFVGAANAWRTKTWGMGSLTVAQFREQCNAWFGNFSGPCGDWVEIASPSLIADVRGDRFGGAVAAVERTAADTSTGWAATSTGRVFISKNVDAEPAASVAWTRIDLPTTPDRFVTGIHVDPANGNHAWVSYSGYDATTPATPGHVFEVTYDPATSTAVWTDRSFDLGDLPINDVVHDNVRGDLYASSDFGVMRLASGATSWTLAASGMSNVAVSGLTFVPGARKIYAATHGLGAWQLNLP